MSAGPMALEIVVEALSNLADGQAGGVGGHQSAGAARGGDFLQQGAFNSEIFGDDFDDPVGFGAPGQVIFEIADGDARCEIRGEKGGGPTHIS